MKQARILTAYANTIVVRSKRANIHRKGKDRGRRRAKRTWFSEERPSRKRNRSEENFRLKRRETDARPRERREDRESCWIVNDRETGKCGCL